MYPPTAYAAQPTAYAVQPTAYAPQPGAYVAQPKEICRVYFVTAQLQLSAAAASTQAQFFSAILHPILT